jgi:hypothetical protein
MVLCVTGLDAVTSLVGPGSIREARNRLERFGGFAPMTRMQDYVVWVEPSPGELNAHERTEGRNAVQIDVEGRDSEAIGRGSSKCIDAAFLRLRSRP